MSSNKFILHGMGVSSCCKRVIITALENSADFEINLVDLRKGEHKQPAHLARQPFGVIPALSEESDPSFVVYESRAIARYVNDTRGNKLIPSDSKKRALMEQWISLEQGTITPEVSGIVGQRVFAPMFGGKADEEIVKKHAEKSKQGLDIMDAHLAKNQYLAGDQFSLADVFFMPYFNLTFFTPEKELLESRKNIAAWWKRVSERDSWKNAQVQRVPARFLILSFSGNRPPSNTNNGVTMSLQHRQSHHQSRIPTFFLFRPRRPSPTSLCLNLDKQ